MQEVDIKCDAYNVVVLKTYSFKEVFIFVQLLV
jgi:hypothetical protein